MLLRRLFPVILAMACLPWPAFADMVPAMIGMETPSSFDMTVTRDDGSIVFAKTYMEIDRTRADFNANGIDLEVIARHDMNKMVAILPEQSVIMQAGLDDPMLARFRSFISAFSLHNKYNRIGQEMCEGYKCTKYEVISNTGQLFYFWYDHARDVPVKVVAANGNVTLVVTNFKRGHQPAILFDIPAGGRHERYYSIPPFFPKGKSPPPAEADTNAAPGDAATPDNGMTPPGGASQ